MHLLKKEIQLFVSLMVLFIFLILSAFVMQFCHDENADSWSSDSPYSDYDDYDPKNEGGTYNSDTDDSTGNVTTQQTTLPTPNNTAATTNTEQEDSGTTATDQADWSATNSTAEEIPDLESTNVPVEDPKETDFFYFSYDDSASTVAVELCKYLLAHDTLPVANLARPWEFLNYESFEATQTESVGVFKASLGIWEHAAVGDPSKTVWEVGAQVVAPTITTAERKNVVLTLVIDVSGSMETYLEFDSGESKVSSRLDGVKFGLSNMVSSLKDGDFVHMVEFSDDAGVILEKYTHGTDGTATLQTVIDNLRTIGSTNLNSGVQLGYDWALKNYDSKKINRVVLITDAYANDGVIDPTVISKNITISEKEGIYFSGIGVGSDFQEEFLNELTEAGRGGYFALQTAWDARRIFTTRFIPLLNVAARNVQFRLDYPSVLSHGESAGEEVSTDPKEVQPTNFSFNTAQYFLETFTKTGDIDTATETIQLTIHYKDPTTGAMIDEIIEKPIDLIMGKDLKNIKDAHAIVLLTKLIGKQLSENEVQNELTALFEGYSSTLFDEYESLIQTYMELNP